MEHFEILDVIVDRCCAYVANQHVPVVVFDLDATLFNNCPRTIAILSEFAEEAGETELLQALFSLKDSQLPYHINDVLMLANAREEIFETAHAFWQRLFFTDAYQDHDIPVPGASQFVRRLLDVGTSIVYLSGRDVPGMLVGCVKSLREHGFPIGVPHTQLLLKPNFHMGDTEFKENSLEYIGNLGPVVAAFDNEPGNCNLFYQRWPSALSICMDTHCSPGAPALMPGVVSIPHFA